MAFCGLAFLLTRITLDAQYGIYPPTQRSGIRVRPPKLCAPLPVLGSEPAGPPCDPSSNALSAVIQAAKGRGYCELRRRAARHASLQCELRAPIEAARP